MRMLIVEDQERHLKDAKSAVQKLSQKFELEVRYASTLDAAKEQLDWAEVVVSDLFFPARLGESPNPPKPPSWLDEEDMRAIFAEENISGIKLAKLVLEQKKVVVVCTSTHHHGEKTQPACDWMRIRGMNLVDGGPKDREGEVRSKEWTNALLLAIALNQMSMSKFDEHNRLIRDFLRDGKLPRGANPVMREIISLYRQITVAKTRTKTSAKRGKTAR